MSSFADTVHEAPVAWPPPKRLKPMAGLSPDGMAPRAITPAEVTERLSSRLRDLVGPGRRWSYAEISARTLIDIRTLKAYVRGTACPNLAKYKRLVVVMGPEVAMDLNRMLGWTPRIGNDPPEALDLNALETALLRADQALTQLHRSPPRGSKPATPQSGLAAARAADTLPEFAQSLHAQDITPTAIAARLSYRLKRMLNADGGRSISDIAEATGISRGVIEAYVAGTACPNLARYFRLERVLGQELGIEFALMLGWTPRFHATRDIADPVIADLHDRVRACLHTLARIKDAGEGSSLSGRP
ncbi:MULTISPECIES: helix-turn-helix transcriptional regulator [unclassified Chelatococcus]|uniref:helix-turn-helix domain-containing protein n=1 Tax=unclassified Chelatococcus TaxID=2638111 RepID=UPI001BCE1408|nr:MULTISPECIES: helix-turn-helix transcriptional regulator [unclassified Chelatococcus]CAH1656343.1 conserved hypothetical protein [Hyphomicrobiales bacterium]MBS7742469.1 helix-turn-helix transcriptional regulator [Chelatococcus sp. HY11]MBX3542413.1 helix-turn-helix transcriptional regulator [Chelatococcus sp.]MCO5075370.1 helix-turn-helix transcriptional regulator [Chelatococcus sp.]CAH1695817.1 conserved hypothetical protein [Hyphomicrobiales bacterium]